VERAERWEVEGGGTRKGGARKWEKKEEDDMKLEAGVRGGKSEEEGAVCEAQGVVRGDGGRGRRG